SGKKEQNLGGHGKNDVDSQRTNCVEESVHVIFDEQREACNRSAHEDIEEIGMAPSTNLEGEPGTQDEGTHDKMLNIHTVKSSEQGVSPNVAPRDTVEAPEPTTSINSSGDELGSAQATEHQEI
ncbi:hypothetical protein HAX54_043946, partial [Datura stramonium]|nr:hypothetical protein [Datura stramonium]